MQEKAPWVTCSLQVYMSCTWPTAMLCSSKILLLKKIPQDVGNDISVTLICGTYPTRVLYVGNTSGNTGSLLHFRPASRKKGKHSIF